MQNCALLLNFLVTVAMTHIYPKSMILILINLQILAHQVRFNIPVTRQLIMLLAVQ
jgi:hypothetical protein